MRLRGCAGSPEHSSLGPFAISTIFLYSTNTLVFSNSTGFSSPENESYKKGDLTVNVIPPVVD